MIGCVSKSRNFYFVQHSLKELSNVICQSETRGIFVTSLKIKLCRIIKADLYLCIMFLMLFLLGLSVCCQKIFSVSRGLPLSTACKMGGEER